jgi:transposase
MCPLGSYTMLRQSKDRTYLRFEMVRYAREHGLKAAARHFSTTVKTVRKWFRRWQPASLQGLSDRSRAPLHPRQGITARERQRAIALKQRLPSWGAERLKRDFSLSLSAKALCRIWRAEGSLTHVMQKRR